MLRCLGLGRGGSRRRWGAEDCHQGLREGVALYRFLVSLHSQACRHLSACFFVRHPWGSAVSDGHAAWLLLGWNLGLALVICRGPASPSFRVSGILLKKLLPRRACICSIRHRCLFRNNRVITSLAWLSGKDTKGGSPWPVCIHHPGCPGVLPWVGGRLGSVCPGVWHWHTPCRTHLRYWTSGR